MKLKKIATVAKFLTGSIHFQNSRVEGGRKHGLLLLGVFVVVFCFLTFIDTQNASASSIQIITPDGDSAAFNTKSDANNLVWLNPASFTLNGYTYTTSANYCNGAYDGIYTCAAGDNHKNSNDGAGGFEQGYIWYWPNKSPDSPTCSSNTPPSSSSNCNTGKAILTPVNGKCVTAFVIHVTGDTNAVSLMAVSLSAQNVNKLNLGHCYFNTKPTNTNTDQNSINNLRTTTINDGRSTEGPPHISDANLQGKQTTDQDNVGTNYSYNGTTVYGVSRFPLGLRAFATDYGWVDQSTIQLYPSSNQSAPQLFTYKNPSDPNDAPVVQVIEAGLKQSSSSISSYANGNYKFYVSDRCIDNNAGNVTAFIVVDPSNPLSITILHNNGNGGPYYGDWNRQDGDQSIPNCMIDNNEYQYSPNYLLGGNNNSATIGIGDVANYQQASGSGTPSIGGGNASITQSGGDGTQPECGSSNTDLSWIICPIYKLVQKAADDINGMITSLMQINSCDIFGQPGTGSTCTGSFGETSGDYHQAWSSMRNIALVIIVITGLIMIIAQAVGSQAVDAYTIKSVMPRLLIAAIFIALSWIILQFFVDLSNVLGLGVRELIYAPFSHLSATSSVSNGIGGTVATTGVLAGVGTIGVLTGVIAGAGIGTLLMVALMLVIAVVEGLLVIVLRNLLVVFLIIVAPVAIALYALPNTQKAFKMWWDNFIKALMMFPIIIAFIAVGRVFSLVALVQSNAGHPVLNGIVAIVAYILPLFLLPMTFKLAGGAMGAIGGGLHQMSGRMKAPLKKKMQEGMARNRQLNKTGERFSGNNRFGKAFNKVGAGVGSGGIKGAFGLNQRGKANVERMRRARTAEKLKEDGVQELLQDDDVRLALMQGSKADGRAALESKYASEIAAGGARRDTAMSKINRAMGGANSIEFNASSRLAALQAEASSAGKGRNIQDSAEMLKYVHSIATATGMDEERLKQDTMYGLGTNGRFDLRQESVGDVLDKKYEGGTAAGGSDVTMNRLGAEMNNRLNTGNDDRKLQTAAQMLATEESKVRMTEPARQAWNDQMEAAGVDFTSQEPIEFQLAKRIDPAAAAAYAATAPTKLQQDTLRQAQVKVNDEVTRFGKASSATMADYTSARSTVESASAAARIHGDRLDKIATQIRAESSTYGSTTPRVARDTP